MAIFISLSLRLFKIKKGKQEQYLKDESDLNSYFLQTALENSAIYVTADAPPLSGSALEDLCQSYLVVKSTIDRLSRRYDEELLEKLIYVRRLDASLVENQEAMDGWLADLLPMLNSDLGISESCELKWLNESETRDWRSRAAG